MKQILAELWNGNLIPSDACGRDDAAIQTAVRLLEEYAETLNNELGEIQKARFEKYRSCAENCMDLLTEQAFCIGFCIAGRMFAEVFVETE